jgi:hypothetical protein
MSEMSQAQGPASGGMEVTRTLLEIAPSLMVVRTHHLQTTALRT